MKLYQKSILSLLTLAVLLTALAGCGAKPAAKAAEIPAFSIAIEGVDGVTAFTEKDAAKLTITTLDTAVTNKKGETTTAKYTGILLKDLLGAIGVTELTALKLEASDGYASEYDSALAFADDVIVGWLKDGTPLEGGAVNILPANGSGNQQVKSAVKLTIVK